MSTKIDEFIKRDHDDFRLMFEFLWNSGTGDVELRKEVYPFLVNRIIAHHVAEEATIFPVMEKISPLLPITLVLIEEHRGMAILARDLAELPYEDRLWRPRIFPFYDVISAHWEKEETDLFPHSPFYLTGNDLVDNGTKFEKILHQQWKIKGVHGGIPTVMFRR